MCLNLSTSVYCVAVVTDAVALSNILAIYTHGGWLSLDSLVARVVLRTL